MSVDGASSSPRPTVIVKWWQDEHGYFGVNDDLHYAAGGSTYEELRARVAESADVERWGAWFLVPDLIARGD